MPQKKVKSKKKNNKKRIRGVIVIVLIIAIIFIIVGIFKNNNDGLRLSKLYDKLLEKKSYSFTTTLDDNNKNYYAEQDNDKAYIKTLYEGTESEFIIREGNTYLIVDDVKEYYTYKNNNTDLGKIESILRDLKNLEHENGKEKINNKTYKYEEYKVLTPFAILEASEIREDEEVKTRFYFKGNDLVYIKTIVGKKEELLKVDISNKVDKKMFSLPSDYNEIQ